MSRTVRFALVFAGALIAAAVAAPLSAAAEMIHPGPPVPVIPVTGAANGEDAAGEDHPSPPMLVPDPEKLRRAKARGAAGSSASAPSTRAPGPKAAIFGGLNSQGLVAPAGSGTPPDSTGAIGPSHYIEMINSAGLALYARTNLAAPIATSTLAAFNGLSGNQFDPQMQFDPVANRWFYVMDRIVSSSSNFLALGWSKTANPATLTNADWCHFTINTGAEFDDYPKLGHSDTHIIIGSNVFSTTAFLTSRIWAVPKPANGDTSCAVPGGAFPFGSAASPLSTADGHSTFTPVPANTFGPSPNGYVVAADSEFFVPTPSQIMVWHVSGPAGAPTLTPDGNLNVTSFEFPFNVPQPGTGFTLDSLDARLTQAVAQTDPAVGALAVWTQHTINGPGNRAQVRWYELLPASLTVRQEGNIADPAHFVFNGAISPTSNGAHAAINYNRGSSTLLAEIRGQSRLSETPLGQMTGDVLVASSAGIMQDFSCSSPFGPPCRWGDYAGASPDPNNTRAVWGTSQFNQTPSGTSARWATQNFALDVGLDTNPPDTSAAGPLGLPGTPNPSFTFTATEPGTFQCSLDGAAFAACTSPQAYTGLASGAHTFAVRAVDFAPNPDPSPATIAFNVADVVAPDLDLSAKKKQDAEKKIKLKAEASEACELEVKGRVKPKGEQKGKLKPKTEDLQAGDTESLKLKPSGKLKKALNEAEKGKATITGTCTDAAGNEGEDKAKVKLN